MLYILKDEDIECPQNRIVLDGPAGHDIAGSEAAFYQRNPKCRWEHFVEYLCTAHGFREVEFSEHEIRDGYREYSRDRKTGFEAITQNAIDKQLVRQLVDATDEALYFQDVHM